MTISGRSTTNGQPHALDLHSDDIRPFIEASLEKVIIAARNVLEKTPPDLVADIVEQGVTLSGGSAYTHGIEEYLSRKLHVEAELAQDPLLCSVKGAFIALTHLADYKRSLLGL
jgi:rod shape-determining protein MreB